MNGQSKSWANRVWLFLTILLVAFSAFRFPQATINPLLDPSWNAVLGYAHEHGWQFGRDLVFTYGPLGFLSVECFLPAVGTLRMVFEITLGCGIATGLCLLAWRIEPGWRVILLLVFLLVSLPLHWGGDDLLLLIGLFCWGLLCILENGPRLKLFIPLLILLAAVCALTKFNLLVVSVFTLGLIAGDLMLRGKWVLAAVTLIGFVLAFVAGWLGLGQKLPGLGNFLCHSFAIAKGYNETMGLQDMSWAWLVLVPITAWIAVVLRTTATSLYLDSKFSAARRSLLLAWITGLFFLDWKYASIRTDYDHVSLMLGFMPLVVLALEALPAVSPRAFAKSRLITAVCIVIALILLNSLTSVFFLAKSTRQAGRKLSGNIAVLSNPSRYLQEKEDALRAEQKSDQLPKIRAAVGNATVDVFGYNQSLALLNELNYHPRPVFQSYSVYTRQLMELNEQFYRSTNAPEYVLFNLTPIDGRFPPLEDAFVLRQMLANYAVITNEADFLLFQKKSGANIELAPLREGSVQPGEKINLPAETALWLEIDLRPNWLGRLQQLVYQPPTVKLSLWNGTNNSLTTNYYAPAPMLSAGFLVNPLVLDNNDVRGFYADTAPHHAEACSVDLGQHPLEFWQSPIHFRIYRIKNNLGTRSNQINNSAISSGQ